MFHQPTLDHLRGIVGLWLYNHEPIEPYNDTRYDFFQGDWYAAHGATQELLAEGYIEVVDGDEDDIRSVKPTALGIAAAMR